MNAHPIQRISIAGLAAIALAVPMHVGAKSVEDNACTVTQTIEPGTVSDLIAWIVAKTGWTTQEPPLICFVSLGQLPKIYHGDGGASSEPEIGALYSNKTHKVYLLDNWKPDNLHDRATLLHELVHHLQRLNNVKAACLAANEPQAYHLELEWLREQGIQDPYKFLDIDEFTIRLNSQCAGDMSAAGHSLPKCDAPLDVSLIPEAESATIHQ